MKPLFIFHLLWQDEESIPPELRDTVEYEELMKLKKMKMNQLGSTSSGTIKPPSFKVI